MKKTILGIAFLMMASVAGIANAQNTTSCAEGAKCEQTACKDKKACKDKDCKDKKDCKGRAECKGKKEGKGPKGCAMKAACQASLFEGLNLSDAQKEKVADLDKAMETSRIEMMQAAKEAKKDIVKAENDIKADRRAAQKELRTKYIDDLQKILTPEQFTGYLKNFYINAGSQGNHAKIGHAKINGRMDGAKVKAEKKFDGKMEGKTKKGGPAKKGDRK